MDQMKSKFVVGFIVRHSNGQAGAEARIYRTIQFPYRTFEPKTVEPRRPARVALRQNRLNQYRISNGHANASPAPTAVTALMSHRPDPVKHAGERRKESSAGSACRHSCRACTSFFQQNQWPRETGNNQCPRGSTGKATTTARYVRLRRRRMRHHGHALLAPEAAPFLTGNARRTAPRPARTSRSRRCPRATPNNEEIRENGRSEAELSRRNGSRDRGPDPKTNPAPMERRHRRHPAAQPRRARRRRIAVPEQAQPRRSRPRLPPSPVSIRDPRTRVGFK